MKLARTIRFDASDERMLQMRVNGPFLAVSPFPTSRINS